MRRWPAVLKVLNETKPADKRVRVYGTVVSVEQDNGKIIIDDGSGSKSVFFNSIEMIERLESYKPGVQVTVIGWAGESGIDGEILRRVKGFEPENYKNILEVWKNVWSKTERSELVSQSD
ncbi:MAG: hypothetical protein GOU99_00945 [Candidatus Altiarchaeota archaeon]|nr:hypothetical protein [Candidatus Altiarchaeota archaeon]